MLEIIIVSHGDYAKAMLESAELILGEQKHVYTFGLHQGESVDELREKISETIEKVQQDGEVLVLTDMLSGSPFNAVASLMKNYSFKHITGVNLPVLLEILLSRYTAGSKWLYEDLIYKGRETILDVNKFFEETAK